MGILDPKKPGEVPKRPSGGDKKTDESNWQVRPSIDNLIHLFPVTLDPEPQSADLAAGRQHYCLQTNLSNYTGEALCYDHTSLDVLAQSVVRFYAFHYMSLNPDVKNFSAPLKIDLNISYKPAWNSRVANGIIYRSLDSEVVEKLTESCNWQKEFERRIVSTERFLQEEFELNRKLQ